MQVPSDLSRSVARQALPISAVAGGVGLAVLAVAAAISASLVVVAGAALVVLAIANLAFFRNPDRAIAGDEYTVVSPADGRVVEVREVEDPDGFVGHAQRVAIFLSVLNVHVNRAPLAGKIRAVRRKGTEFLAAFNKNASERNVQLRMDMETASGLRLAVVQITGLIARRIVCYPEVGDDLERGMPYGLICYGSRVELYLPVDSDVRVRVGDRVRGGSSIIGEVRT